MDIDYKKYSEYNKRQLNIKSFGSEKQKRLLHGSVLVVGLGGLGCPSSLYLTVSGLGKIGLCDFDVVELSNISRQVLFSVSDVGKKKTEVAKKILQEKSPYVKILEHRDALEEKNAEDIIREYDCVLDCTDNFRSKYQIHKTCQKLKKDLVQAALYQTQGHVTGFAFSQKNKQICMRCFWGDEPNSPNIRSCAEAGILSVVAGSVALKQCTTALQFLTSNYKNSSMNSLYNYSDQSWDNIAFPVSKNCNCAEVESENPHQKDIEVENIPSNDCCILDLRNPEDQNNCFGIYKVYKTNNNEIQNASILAKNLYKEKTYIAVCYAGIRSYNVVRQLRDLGVENVFSFKKGYKHFPKLK